MATTKHKEILKNKVKNFIKLLSTIPFIILVATQSNSAESAKLLKLIGALKVFLENLTEALYKEAIKYTQKSALLVTQ